MTAAAPEIFSRRPGLDTRLVDDEVFVITRTTIQHFNATAAVVWLLLEEPAGRRELHAALRSLYPAVTPQRLSADLGRLLAAFRAADLIRAVTAPAASPA